MITTNDNFIGLNQVSFEAKLVADRMERIDWHFRFKNRLRLKRFIFVNPEIKRDKLRHRDLLAWLKALRSLLCFYKMKSTGDLTTDLLVVKYLGDWRTESDTISTTVAKVY